MCFTSRTNYLERTVILARSIKVLAFAAIINGLVAEVRGQTTDEEYQEQYKDTWNLDTSFTLPRSRQIQYSSHFGTTTNAEDDGKTEIKAIESHPYNPYEYITGGFTSDRNFLEEQDNDAPGRKMFYVPFYASYYGGTVRWKKFVNTQFYDGSSFSRYILTNAIKFPPA